jgi:hypothetical protein
MANKPQPKPTTPDSGKFGQQKGNVKPSTGAPSGGPPPKPAVPPKR